MKTVALKTHLKEGLEIAERITARSPSLPVLANVLLSAKKEQIKIAATDLQMGVTYQFLGTIQEEGMVVFPAQLLSSLLAVSSDEKVSLETKEQVLLVQVGSHAAEVKIVDAEEFPIIPSLQGGEAAVQVETPVLCKSLSQVVGMVGQSQARPEISGIFFVFGKNGGHVVATDSFRLAERRFPLGEKDIEEQSFILPAKTARELISALGDRQGKTTVYFSSSQTVFVCEDSESPTPVRIEIVSRLIEGEYPHYEDVIPSSHKTFIAAPKNDLLNHLKAAGIFAGKTQEIRILAQPDTGEVVFISENAETGSHRSSLKGEVTGENGGVAFNWRFLLEGLVQLKGERVELGLNGEDGPALLRSREQPGQSGEGYRYILMPIKA